MIINNILELIQKIAYWTVPLGLYDLGRSAKAKLLQKSYLRDLKIRELCNRHQGQRCFILATGLSFSFR